MIYKQLSGENAKRTGNLTANKNSTRLATFFFAKFFLEQNKANKSKLVKYNKNGVKIENENCKNSSKIRKRTVRKERRNYNKGKYKIFNQYGKVGPKTTKNWLKQKRYSQHDQSQLLN